MQIQHDFSGTPLPVLAELGLEVYELIPDFRDCCPLCGGSGCAVRHGLYRRRVVDREGVVIPDFPVPRFRCRGNGPRVPAAATFSVLPSELVARRLCSLPFMLAVLQPFLISGCSMRQVLDEIADSFRGAAVAWLAEATTIYRMVRLLARTHVELTSHPVLGLNLRRTTGLRKQAGQVVDLLSPPGRSSPLVLAFHSQYFPRLLLEPSRTNP